MEDTELLTKPSIDLAIEGTPGVMWEVHDDLCDCTFQRIGWWTNPYMGATLLVRLCCMWKKLDEMFPGMVKEIPAFYNYNEGRYEDSGTMDWNGEADMPRAVWYRQLAMREGLSLADIRIKYSDQEPPKGI